MYKDLFNYQFKFVICIFMLSFSFKFVRTYDTIYFFLLFIEMLLVIPLKILHFQEQRSPVKHTDKT